MTAAAFPAPAFEFPVRRIAVVRALALGDLLCAVPALRALRSAFPDAEITLIGQAWAAGLVKRFPAYLDDHATFPGFPGIPEVPFDAASVHTFLASALARSFDLAVQLHGSGLSSNAFAALLGARATVGFVPPGAAGGPPPAPGRWLPYPAHGHESRRLLELPRALGATGDDHPEFPLDSADREALAELRATVDEDALEPGCYAVVHAGATDPQRRWSLTGFARVADALASAGLRVVLTGTAAESGLTADLRRAMTAPALDVAGRTSLGALAGLIDGARLVVTNDTGISHVAAGRGTPSVVIFRASDPERWAPIDAGRHRAVGGGSVRNACGHEGGGHRCLGDTCTLVARTGTRATGEDAPIDEVLAAVHAQLRTPAVALP
jgi:ADP-heptose:LPS heptosyltransferase